jgi:aminopeptidase N
MNDKWETDGQVEVKITRWPDALKYLHHLKDSNDPRWKHVYQLKSGLFRSGKAHCPARWLVEHMSENYNARVDAEMQSDLNLRFIRLHGIKNAQSEHLQLLCTTKYRDTVNNNIDNTTSLYCGIKLSLDLPTQKGKHRLLKSVPGVNGEKTYHYVQYNG